MLQHLIYIIQNNYFESKNNKYINLLITNHKFCVDVDWDKWTIITSCFYNFYKNHNLYFKTLLYHIKDINIYKRKNINYYIFMSYDKNEGHFLIVDEFNCYIDYICKHNIKKLIFKLNPCFKCLIIRFLINHKHFDTTKKYILKHFKIIKNNNKKLFKVLVNHNCISLIDFIIDKKLINISKNELYEIYINNIITADQRKNLLVYVSKYMTYDYHLTLKFVIDNGFGTMLSKIIRKF